MIAPGTRNSNSGLHITLNGTPEVSTRVYGTIKTQNIYLKKGEYGVMVEAHDVKAEDFANGGMNTIRRQVVRMKSDRLYARSGLLYPGKRSQY